MTDTKGNPEDRQNHKSSADDDSLLRTLSVGRDDSEYWDALTKRVHTAARREALQEKPRFYGGSETRWLAARAGSMSFLAAAAVVIALFLTINPSNELDHDSEIFASRIVDIESIMSGESSLERVPSIVDLLLYSGNEPGGNRQ